jgi:cytochrome oxidase Cu insertion factor (SCO1/SenC/PrrC family)
MRNITMLGLAMSVLVAGVSAAQAPQAASQTPAPAGPPAVELKVGDAAPAFSMAGSDGKTHKLSDYKGKAVVLAWFPKAFTGG